MNQVKSMNEILGFDYWELRIGIHCGSVVAGVIGKKKFTYDIWGDTVNIASRMESSRTSGEINISQSTFDLINSYFHCTPHGKIKAKNKGKIEMYFLKRIKEKYAQDELGMNPNDKFLK